MSRRCRTKGFGPVQAFVAIKQKVVRECERSARG